MPPFLGHKCWYSFDSKTPFPGVKAILTCCVCADLFFFFFFGTLKECIADLLDILCSDKT